MVSGLLTFEIRPAKIRSLTSGIIADGDVIGSCGTAGPWLDFI
jgi:hypothetical protein